MIGYVTLGTNHLEEAAKFYDALLAELGAKRILDMGRLIGWGISADQPMFILAKPWDQKEATVGNGVMVGLAAPSREVVDRVYAKALELGGSDEGAPGIRFGNFYAGYFRDPEGNKLDAFCILP